MNKNRMIKGTAVALTICAVSMGLSVTPSQKISAASTATTTTSTIQKVELSPKYVPDIDNVLYPATSQYYTYDSTQGAGSFTITKPTIVKAYFNWDTTKNATLSGNVWFSKDAEGIDVIGSTQKLSKAGDSILIFLDPGNYYLHHYVTIKSSSSASTEVSKLKFGVALLAEDVKSDESTYVSSFASSNFLTLGVTRRGFLSTTSPIDYFRIRIYDYSQVNVAFNFEQTDDTNLSKAVCTLYDQDYQKITSQKFSTAGEGKNVMSQMLEPGIYYVTLSGATAATSIKAEAISYDVSTNLSTKKWTNKDVVVSVSTEFDTTEELVVSARVADNKIQDSSIWKIKNDNCSEIENGKFSATKNGVYSIRVKDENKNYVLKRIKISNIDKTAPVASGVKHGQTYTGTVTIKFWDQGGSGIKKATLNGTEITSGYEFSKKGTHILKVYDNAGNIRTVKFTIK